MMKLSTIATTTATLLLLSSEAYAAHEETSTRTRRMRSVKIYSSTPQHNEEFGKDIVDPYIGLPDEREQRGLLKHNKPSVVESVPLPTANLEMSMPTADTSMPAHQSLSYPLKGSTSTAENDVIPYQRGLKHNKSSTGSVPNPTLEMSMPTGASMPVQSFSYSLEDSTSTEAEENDVLIRRRAAEEETYNSAMMVDHSSVAAAAAAIVSAIAGVVALV
mmetsp:Transcript_18789/g.27871  ORF Transcript_18789/g.27871 Transcript_18789/m.27871 type:complete len:218 (+) Transcript_18789:225-878(+)